MHMSARLVTGLDCTAYVLSNSMQVKTPLPMRKPMRDLPYR